MENKKPTRLEIIRKSFVDFGKKEEPKKKPDNRSFEEIYRQEEEEKRKKEEAGLPLSEKVTRSLRRYMNRDGE